MPYAILDKTVRQNLEQERDRLTKDRESIIKEAVAEATAEIDQTISNLNGLLGGEAAAPSTNGKGKTKKVELPEAEAPVEEAKPKQQRKGRGKAKAAVEEATTTATPEKKTRGKAKNADEPKPKRNVKPPVPFDATMKRDFKGMTPAEAVFKAMSDSPTETFTTDEMIEILYGPLPSINMPEARKRIALMMAHGMRKGTYEKVGENPSQFKIAKK